MTMTDADWKPCPFWSGWILLALVSKEFLKSILYSVCLTGECVQAWAAGCEQKELQIELRILNAMKTAGSLDWSGPWVYFCETAGCAAAQSVTNHHWMWLGLKKIKKLRQHRGKSWNHFRCQNWNSFLHSFTDELKIVKAQQSSYIAMH